MERKTLVRDLCILLVGFVGMVLCVIVVSLVEKYVIPAFSAEAYGLETESPSVFVMPEDPILKIYAYEKDEYEIQSVKPLVYQTPVNTGPGLYWYENTCTWKHETILGCLGEIPLCMEFEGKIEIQMKKAGEPWEQAYFTGKSDGFLPDLSSVRQFNNSKISGTNTLSFVLAGCTSVSGRSMFSKEECHTLAEKISGSVPSVYNSILQYSDTKYLHITCVDIADSSTAATATVRLDYVSEWVNAGNKCRIAEGSKVVGYDESLLYYAQVKPTWTIELVEYWQREG